MDVNVFIVRQKNISKSDSNDIALIVMGTLFMLFFHIYNDF